MSEKVELRFIHHSPLPKPEMVQLAIADYFTISRIRSRIDTLALFSSYEGRPCFPSMSPLLSFDVLQDFLQ
jgi:hypothetical protein